MAIFTDVFEDVTKQGRKIPTSDYHDSGSYPIIDQGQAEIAGYTDEENGLFTDVPAIIFGDHTRVVKYVDTPCFLGADGVKLLKAKIPNPNYKYLYYVLSNANIPNTGYNRHFKWLKEVDVPLPSEMEQQKTVDTLDRIGKLIALRKEQLAKLDQLVKSRFIELFGKYADTTRLSEVAAVTGGLTKNSKRDQLPLQMPYLRVANVGFASIDVTEMLDIGLTKEECKKTLLQYEDLLFVEGNGSPDQIGRVAIWRNEIRPCVHQNHLIKSRFDQSVVNPVFAMHYFMSQRGREQIKGKAVSTSGLYTLSVSKVAELLMPVPPMALQKSFASFVEQTDKSKWAIQQSLDKLELLKKSSMQKYFG